MRAVIVLILGCAALAASLSDDPRRAPQRIVGGEETEITEFPEMASLLFSRSTTGHSHVCGGSILNHRSILSAAHCFENDPVWRWKARVGSTFSHTGGVVHDVDDLIMHPYYDMPVSIDNDVAVMRVHGSIEYGDSVRPAVIATPNYQFGDNEVVWATGWGRIVAGGALSVHLRKVQVWTINQADCRMRYATRGGIVTENMLCSGWLDQGGRGQCQGDSGGPVYHNGTVIGICSWSRGCADSFFPTVNARVSRFTEWIELSSAEEL